MAPPPLYMPPPLRVITVLRFSKYNEPETREDNFGTKEILGRRE